jgi:hypothetical protein
VPTAYRYGPNRIALDGAPVDVGFSVDLTIDPSLQALAQKTAACYTGRQDVCAALGISAPRTSGRRSATGLLEGAMVRMAAVAVIDVASGRIEALAGALSPCARDEVDGPGRSANCDRRLPYKAQYRPMRCSTRPCSTTRCRPRRSSRSWPPPSSPTAGRGRSGSPPSAPR